MCVEVACASSSELMVDRYTQILHYVYLWQTFWEAEGVGHKLSVLFKGPGWTPGKPRMGCIEDIPQVRVSCVTDIKYMHSSLDNLLFVAPGEHEPPKTVVGRSASLHSGEREPYTISILRYHQMRSPMTDWCLFGSTCTASYTSSLHSTPLKKLEWGRTWVELTARDRGAVLWDHKCFEVAIGPALSVDRINPSLAVRVRDTVGLRLGLGKSLFPVCRAKDQRLLANSHSLNISAQVQLLTLDKHLNFLYYAVLKDICLILYLS